MENVIQIIVLNMLTQNSRFRFSKCGMMAPIAPLVGL